MSSKPKIALISLGCSKNLVDSEHMLGLLRERGYGIAPGLEDAQVAVINTCGFIQSAVEEAIDTILEVSLRKKRGELERVFVTGCFVQRYGYKLQKEIPEVDGWLGTGEIGKIGDLLEGAEKGLKAFHINRPEYIPGRDTPRIQTTPFYSAYLKIAEGCSNQCTYCTIPSLRGPQRSRTPDSIIREAEGMAARGVKEVNLIAQDTTAYGRDLKGKIGLEDLLERLIHIRELQWIRVLYSHPHRISHRLLKMLEKEENLCPYLDIPFQHVSEEVLKAMGRHSEKERPRDLVERVRALGRPLSLRTTLMVGFPGETERAFQELMDFVEWGSFEHLGTFVYSPEKGTRAARLGNPVSREKAMERQDRVMALQKRISKRKNKGLVGQRLQVLIEGESPETELLLRGRTAGMAPDVDSQVLINKGVAVIGDIVTVRITEAHPYDVVGEVV